MTSVIQRLPDAHGMIARVKAGLSKNCAVARSPYCEIIISMRMQSIDYRTIENWLIEQGPEHRISAPTLWRNLKRAKLRVELPYAEQLAEEWGGRFDIDLSRELTGQIYAQRQRVDKMQKQEAKRQERSPGYFDKRLRHERETLVNLIRQQHSMMKSPLEAAQEAVAARGLLGRNRLQLTDDAAAVLGQMLLSGELKVQEPDEEATLP